MIYINRILTLIFFLNLAAFAQVQETNPPDFIKTIQFKSNTPESQLPILRLGEPIILEFDVLNNNEEDFYYEIEHYNFDWTPSVLAKAEFLSGTDNFRIIDYFNSFNTYQIYSHYKLTIPNQQTRGLTKSGNYMIYVYDDYGELMFSRKFMVYEPLVNVGVSVKRSRDVKQIAEMQSVDININSTTINFNNPNETVKVLVIQNNNLYTAIDNLKPQYTLGNELIYRYANESLFYGGNEYLYFETKDLRAASIGVQFINLQDLYNTYLFTNTSRKGSPYTFFPDINGNFVITAIDRSDIDVEADYSQVHFSLAIDELVGKEVYVYGNFNNYALEELNRMTYNPQSRTYQSTFRLKQGFYNYKYVTLDNEGNFDENAISGSYWETENNYKVLAYYRDLGTRYDRLIGFGEINSVAITN